MKVKELIERLTQLNPETEVEFVGLCEYGFGETIEFISEGCHIQEEDNLVQIIIQGEN